MTIARFRLYCLASAIILYALAGTPTPDSPGLIEALVGLLLITGIGLPQAVSVIGQSFKPQAPLWLSLGMITLVYGLTVSLLLGITHGHAPNVILRDIIPFLFMALPVLLYPSFRQHPDWAQPLIALLIVLGVSQSARVLLESYAAPFMPFFVIDTLIKEPHYLANTPSVLFAATTLAGLAIFEPVRRKISISSAARTTLWSGLALIPIAAMALALQRASLGYIVLASGLFGIMALRYKPSLILPFALVCGVLVWSFAEPLSVLFTALIEKTRLFGPNMRWQELGAVWDTINGNWITLLFGTGWGGSFASPAVGGETVTFTHSLLTALLLKNGALGCLLGAGFIAALLHSALITARPPVILAVALAGPVLIDVFLYAAYKSLDFGLVLTALMILTTTKNTANPNGFLQDYAACCKDSR